MVDPNISEQEKQCVRIFAKLLAEGSSWLSGGREVIKAQGLELDYQAYDLLMRMMERYGVIDSVTHVIDKEGRYVVFRITPAAVQMSRELDDLDKRSQEPRDIVAEVTRMARQHRFVAWLIILSFVAGALLTALNQGCQYLKNAGFSGGENKTNTPIQIFIDKNMIKELK